MTAPANACLARLDSNAVLIPLLLKSVNFSITARKVARKLLVRMELTGTNQVSAMLKSASLVIEVPTALVDRFKENATRDFTAALALAAHDPLSTRQILKYKALTVSALEAITASKGQSSHKLVITTL